MSSAGHEPPLILSSDGAFSNFSEAGPPLGIMPKRNILNIPFLLKKAQCIFFTDGITEIKNPSGEMLGSEGFENYIKKYQSTPINERLKTMIDDILGAGHIQKDDFNDCCNRWKIVLMLFCSFCC